jgi:hypothetical protein
MPGSTASDELAHRAMAEGPYEIRPGHTGADYFPNFIEDFVDPKKVSKHWLFHAACTDADRSSV